MLEAHSHDLSEGALESADLCAVGDLVESDAQGVDDFRPSQKGDKRLSAMQARYCREFVANGGNQTAACIAAGYNANSYGTRLMQNSMILAEIKRLSVLNIEAKLPDLIGRLTEIALDPGTPPALAAKTAFDLMDRVGLKPKSGPLIAIQNNNGSSSEGGQLTAQVAQQAIADVWAGRQRRLSAIPDTMADSGRTDDDDAQDAEFEPVGGGDPQGPSARPDPIPPHKNENSPDSAEGQS